MSERLEQKGGVPAPIITHQQFIEIISQPEIDTLENHGGVLAPTIQQDYQDALIRRRWTITLGRPSISPLKRKLIDLLDLGTSEPYKPGDEIIRSPYSIEGQDPLSEDEYALAKEFIKRMYELRRTHPQNKNKRLPGDFSPTGKDFVPEYYGWGFSLLDEFGEELVFDYFKKVKIEIENVSWFVTQRDYENRDRRFLYDILFARYDLEEIFSVSTFPYNHSKEIIEFSGIYQNDMLLDVFAKQFIYFVRSCEGTNGGQIKKKKNVYL